MKNNDSHMLHADAVRKPKKMGLAIILALVLGPFGLLYVSAIGGIAILAFSAVIALFLIVNQHGYISPASLEMIIAGSYLICVLLAVLVTKLHNQKIIDDLGDESTPQLVQQANLLYRFKKVFAVLLMLVIILSVTAYYMYNKPHQNVANSTPDKVLTTDELYKELNGKDSATVASYNNKIYQVTGVVGSINAPNDSTINLLLTIGGNQTDNINCAMDPQFNSKLQNLKAGDKITVKGIFSGVSKFEDKDLGINTMDIILTRAVAIRE